MNNYILWFKKQPQREQYLLITTAALIILTILYLLIWEPVFKSLDSQSLKLQSQKKILLWMNDAEKEVNKLRSSGNALSPQASSQSISTLVERSAISTGIRASIFKMSSDKKQTLKVQFKSVEFDRLTQWLGKLQKDYGITPKRVSIKQADKAGLVSCRVTLEKQTS
ncbi:MAG: type II secretion system protein M [Gammaproteobacteria bacterium]|nr:type II secretion system protein M [Gammaproteobacteria bacterium]